MVDVELKHISRIYEKSTKPAVHRVNIHVKDGEFLTLVGPSGSGKSTCLRMLAGLEPVDEGTILIDGVDVTETRARDRDVAMVFQSYALYPNMTARQNMSFALENAKVPKAEVTRRVNQVAQMLELEDLMDSKPAAMSGGQRQRVSMGRAIVRDPKVFLMDEPLSNLDARLRVSTRAQIASLQRELGTTTVYVTHDQTEAMTMGDRVAVLKDGVLQQCDEPLHLYHHPGNTFVAGFIGSPAMALFDDVRVADGAARLGADGPRVPIPEEFRNRVGEQVIVGVRPEEWRVLQDAPAESGLEVEVEHVEELGAEAYAYVRPAQEAGIAARAGRIAVRLDASATMPVGSSAVIAPSRAVFFDVESEINVEYLG